MKQEWYFSDELCPSSELVDNFADSKFEIDKWTSFAREIIQNSLDAQRDENEPVEVFFDLNKSLKLTDIPGGERTKEILESCAAIATNHQTIKRYKKGLEILSKQYVHCLKISDKNTKGVETGRDKAWGAFVFDEGKSIKHRPGSAGSHGVGKKVPFIISSCNTVFYATKNEADDCLMQGKTTLITWEDSEGKRKSGKGWYGLISEDTNDTRNIVRPIDANHCSDINPYFLRTDEYGTDVIIIGVNIYDNETEVKRSIISAVLESFFVAIKQNKLVINVFGDEINSSNFDDIIRKYYKEQSEKFKVSLMDCLRVYTNDVSCVKDIYNSDGNKIGEVKIYFGLGSEHNKKYYTIVRSHGMRIEDDIVKTADQPFSAVVIIEGQELNDRLATLENAAHDKFITKDDDMEFDKEALKAISNVEKEVKSFITEQSKINAGEDQEIEGLTEFISIPGAVSSVKKSRNNPDVKRYKIPKKPPKPAPPTPPVENEKYVVYENYVLEPTFIKKEKDYLLKLKVADNISKADLIIYSVNSEAKADNTIVDYIESIDIDGKRRHCVSGKVRDISIPEGKIIDIIVKMKHDVTYQLGASICVKEDEKNE